MGQDVQFLVGAPEQAVVAVEKRDQHNSDEDQAGGDGGEDPVQANEFLLIPADHLRAIHERRRRDLRQAALERLQDLHDLPDGAGTVQLLDQRLDGGEGLFQPAEGDLMFGIAPEQLVEVALVEHVHTPGEDVVAQLDLILVDAAVRPLDLREPMLEANEFGGRLTGLPGGIIGGDLPQRTLAFDHQHRNIGAGDHEAANHDGNDRFERAQRQMGSLRKQPCLRYLTSILATCQAERA